jgi:hypothetical protein
MVKDPIGMVVVNEVLHKFADIEGGGVWILALFRNSGDASPLIVIVLTIIRDDVLNMEVLNIPMFEIMRILCTPFDFKICNSQNSFKDGTIM